MSRFDSGRTLVVLLACMVVATVTAQAQTTWYVDDDAPGDPGPGDPAVSDPAEDGSVDHPFDAIQEGIDAAEDDDTVLVQAGQSVNIDVLANDTPDGLTVTNVTPASRKGLIQ